MPHTVGSITGLLRAGTHSFAYRKKDGSLRTARGTLHPDLMPAIDPTKPETQRASRPAPEGVVHYFDLDAGGFRQFHVDNLVDEEGEV